MPRAALPETSRWRRRGMVAFLGTLLLAGSAALVLAHDSAPPAGSGRKPVLRFTFESSLQGWMDLRYEYYRVARTRVRPSTARAWEGRHAMEIQLKTGGDYTKPTIGVYEQFLDRLPAGTRITYQVWFPRAEPLEGIQPYVLYHRPGEAEPIWGSQGLIPIDTLRPGRWNEVHLTVPLDVGSDGVIEVGIEWQTKGPQTATVYLDAISW